MTPTPTYAIVMAGGSGTRFWPLSRPERPKQLLPLAGGTESLLAATVRRAAEVTTLERVLVVTSEALLATIGDKGLLGSSYGSAPPEVPAAVIQWLATESEAKDLLGKTIYAQSFCRKRNLVPGWPPSEA